MKQRPILFKAEMVRAILSGQKTQTRRIYKGLCPPTNYDGVPLHKCPFGEIGDQLWVRETYVIEEQIDSDQKPPHKDGRPIRYLYENMDTWQQPHYAATDDPPPLNYGNGEPECKWKPSIFMPRWASRITLQINNVRVQRLQDISESDAIAEGVDQFTDGTGFSPPLKNGNRGAWQRNPEDMFAALWKSINGADSWDKNPWVWAIEFERVK